MENDTVASVTARDGSGHLTASAGGAGYGSQSLSDFQAWYAHYHGYVSLAVCAYGIICNIFNIVVLTRRNMASTTNCILSGLAVADLLTMVSYVPFALQFYCLYGPRPSVQRNSRRWVYFFLFHVNFSVTAHTVSIWLGVLLAVFRYVFVRLSMDGASVCTYRKAKWLTALVYVWAVFILVPNYLSITIAPVDDTSGSNTVVRAPQESQEATTATAAAAAVVSAVGLEGAPGEGGTGGGGGGEETGEERGALGVGGSMASSVLRTNRTYYDLISIDRHGAYGQTITRLNFWIHALIIKLIPCALMSIFGFLLLGTMRHSHRRTKRLQRQSTRARIGRMRSREHARTTRMLIVVIVLFLFTELPQGILALLSGLLPGFFDAFYVPLGDAMDIIALINNAINFTLYCSMSKQFRDTFLQLFCCVQKTSPPTRFTNGKDPDHNVSKLSYLTTCARPLTENISP